MIRWPSGPETVYVIPRNLPTLTAGLETDLYKSAVTRWPWGPETDILICSDKVTFRARNQYFLISSDKVAFKAWNWHLSNNLSIYTSIYLSIYTSTKGSLFRIFNFVLKLAQSIRLTPIRFVLISCFVFMLRVVFFYYNRWRHGRATSASIFCRWIAILIMKVPDLEAQHGSNIYLSLSEYLSTTRGYRERRLLLMKKSCSLCTNQWHVLNFSLGQITLYSGVVCESA